MKKIQNIFTVASSARNWERVLSLQEYLNRFDLHSEETLKKNIIYSKSEHLTISVRDLCPICEASKVRNTIPWLKLGDPVGRIDGIAESLTTWNALYETKVSQKWNGNEIRK